MVCLPSKHKMVQCNANKFYILQDPIEISSDEEVEDEGCKEELQADGQPVRRTTRSSAHKSTGVQFKV